MKLIVGLGNPSAKYHGTRHNIGFEIVEALVKKIGADFVLNKKFQAEIAEAKINRQKIIFLKPLTFMNNSGLSVFEAKKFFKINTNDVLIVHDDKDILFGKYKLQFDRSSAGHNGVQSIIDRLKTKSFFRLRFGIKPDSEIADTADFVLKKFNSIEKKSIAPIVEEANNLIVDFINRA